MRCRRCGSTNITTQVIRKDKSARNWFVLLLAAILVVLAVAWSSREFSWTVVLAGGICSIPLLIVLRIILAFIPAGVDTYIMCDDCGKTFKK